MDKVVLVKSDKYEKELTINNKLYTVTVFYNVVYDSDSDDFLKRDVELSLNEYDEISGEMKSVEDVEIPKIEVQRIDYEVNEFVYSSGETEVWYDE